MHRVARDIEIDMQTIEDVAAKGRTVFKDATTNGIGACQDEHLGIWHGIVCFEERIRHILRYGTREDDTISMTWRRDKANAETSDVEIDVASGVKFHLATAITARRHLTQL